MFLAPVIKLVSFISQFPHVNLEQGVRFYHTITPDYVQDWGIPLWHSQCGWYLLLLNRGVNLMWSGSCLACVGSSCKSHLCLNCPLTPNRLIMKERNTLGLSPVCLHIWWCSVYFEHHQIHARTCLNDSKVGSADFSCQWVPLECTVMFVSTT